jgi:ubiquinone/menaquinone biosynthesis C-methylase UbiE
LVERLGALAGPLDSRIVDLGAGTGHLTWPLAQIGFRVTAVEPASAMLKALVAVDGALPARVTPVLASAEATGLESAEFDLALIADALHWMDPALVGAEVSRLLAPRGALAIVEVQWQDSPLVQRLQQLFETYNPKARRTRATASAEVFSKVCSAPRPTVEHFTQEVTLDVESFEAFLKSLSFVGPALGGAALEQLVAKAHSLARGYGGARWTRLLTLSWSRREPGERIRSL